MGSGSILKFLNEQGEEHGGLLHWTASADSYPFRGEEIPHLKGDEIDEIPTSLDFHCATFDLTVPEQLKKYISIRDRAANGWFHIHHIHRFLDDPTRVSVYVEWYQIYGELPDGRIPRNGQLNQPTSGHTAQLQQGRSRAPAAGF